MRLQSFAVVIGLAAIVSSSTLTLPFDKGAKELDELLDRAHELDDKIITTNFFQILEKNHTSVKNRTLNSSAPNPTKFINQLIKVIKLNELKHDEDERLADMAKQVVKEYPTQVLETLAKSPFINNLYFWYRFDSSNYHESRFILRNHLAKRLIRQNRLAKNAIIAIKRAVLNNVIPNNKYTDMILNIIKLDLKHRINDFKLNKLDKIG
jgi:hypothetical protein